MTTRILFVCLGNICRSPAAEGVLRALVPEARTDHVPDPYYSGDFDGVLDLIETCARGLAARL